MGNYNVSTYTAAFATLELCTAGLNAKLETFEDDNTIRHMQIFKNGNEYLYILMLDDE